MLGLRLAVVLIVPAAAKLGQDVAQQRLNIYPASPVKCRVLNPLLDFFFGDIYGLFTRYGSQAGHVQFHL